MSKSAAKTGSEPATLVAIEQFFPKNNQVLFDPLQYRFLPWGIKTFVSIARPKPILNLMCRAAEKSAPGLWGGLLCRKRYIDEKLEENIKNVNQAVNLGAGLDTRLYRLPGVGRMRVWELDQSKNIEKKQKAVLQALGKQPENIKLVPIDFDTQNLGDILHTAGYSSEQPTFFIWEAVTQYLTITGFAEPLIS